MKVAHIVFLSRLFPDDGQKNCPKHVELLLPLINNWKIIVHLLVSFKSNVHRNLCGS